MRAAVTKLAFGIEDLVMLRKTTIGLAAVTLLSIVEPHAAAAQYCYGAPGIARCAGVGLGLQSPRWYFSDNYPYWIYDYPVAPYPAFRNVVGGCHLVRRPVLDPTRGWRIGAVQVCD
jgi:hypothetical protein